MNLKKRIMNLTANESAAEIRKQIAVAKFDCDSVYAAYMIGYRDARQDATKLAAAQEKGLTAKEIEAILVAACSIEKRTRETVGRSQKNHQEILDLVLGMIQEKLQEVFCPACGRILPCTCNK